MKARLGIIGGLGSAAGVRMAQQLVELAQQAGASKDEEFPAFTLMNVPTGGMDATGFTDGDLVKSALKHAVKMLDANECRYIAIACNTAYHFYDELDMATHAEVLNMPLIACKETKGCTKVGVLSSESSKALRVYARWLEHLKIEPILTTDDEQVMLNLVIETLIMHQPTSFEAGLLRRIAMKMKDRGAQSVIVGCTELSLLPEVVCQGCQQEIPLIDAGRVTMAKALSLLS